MSRRESSSETRWDVGCCEATGKSAGQQEGGSGRRCDSGSHRVERPVHQLQQATGCWLSLSRAGRALRLENEEQDVLWKELRHEARQEVVRASVIKVLDDQR